MAIKVCKVPYLNYEPYYFDMYSQEFELIESSPSGVRDLLVSGAIDAGPVPTADIPALSDQFDPVGGFAISTAASSGNLFLHAKHPISELDGHSIAIGGEGSTAVKLLKLLLSNKYSLNNVSYVGQKDDHDAILVIGDPALRTRYGMRGFEYKYDLASEWSEWMSLPLVTSKWFASPNLTNSQKILLENTLYVGMEEGVTTLCNTNDTYDHLLMRAKDVTAFIRGFKYFSGLSETKGLSKLLDCFNEMD